MMLRTENLDVGYGMKIILSGVEIWIKRGELTAVLGPNASGKSTLLKTLARLLKPIRGTVLLDSLDLKRYNRKTLARKLGVVLTEPINPRMMRVSDIVALGRYAYTDIFGRLTEYDREVVEDALSIVGADYLADRLFSELSDGEKQKVMIARALAQEPSTLILDEPTTHLDAKNRVEILLLLKKIAKERNIAVVASLHDVELALRIADRLVIVWRNSVRFYENPEEFVDGNTVEQLYGIGDRVRFNTLTYSLEVVNKSSRVNACVFVIAGAGTGARAYRTLSRMGCSIKTGILHRNDIDYLIADRLDIEIVAEEPYTPISHKAYQRAIEAITKSDIIIYTFPPIGPENQLNLNLLEQAKQMGKRIVGIKQRDIDNSPAPQYNMETINLSQLQKYIERQTKKITLRNQNQKTTERR